MGMSGWAKTAAGALTALLVAAGLAAPSAVATGTRDLQVMSWNMCGSQRSTWHCKDTGTPQDKIDVVKYHVRNNDVQVALLQEMCEDDLTALMSQLGPGWNKSFAPYQWSQGAAGKWNSRCGEDDGRADRIGTVILVKGPMAGAQQYPVTQPYVGQQRPFQCATAVTWSTRVCNVHAARLGSNPDHPDWDYRDEQFAEIKSVVDDFPRTVFGGDFNALSPDAANTKDAWLWPAGLYSTGRALGATGYQECDQEQTNSPRTGRATHHSGAKIDYLFSGEIRRGCTVTDSAFSDHHVVIGSVTVSAAPARPAAPRP